MEPDKQNTSGDFLSLSFREKLRHTEGRKQAINGVFNVLKSTPEAMMKPAQASYLMLNDAVSQHLVDELHSYPRKNQRLTFWLWMIFGIFGAHRFYLGKIGTGIGMTLTGGGFLGWWIYDAFKLKEMVDAYNAEQDQREKEGTPPVGMEFVPFSNPEILEEYPPWATVETETGLQLKQRLKKRDIVWDAFALMFFGVLIGGFTTATGYRLAAVATFAIILTINFADYLFSLYHIPLVRGLIRWDYRLRLFYHFNNPGSRLGFYFRPLVGIFYAPFKQKARAEVTLFLEIGGVFMLFNILWGILSGETLNLLLELNFGEFFASWFKGIVLGFFSMYAFAAPIGATLMKNVLLRRANLVRWGLSTLVLYFILSSLSFA